MKRDAEHKLLLNPPGKRILLHACCAPCSSAIVECLVNQGFRPVIFYSNSNIYPESEYLKRKNECIRYAAETGLEIVEDNYDHNGWRHISKGLENEPERGCRCAECFRYRLERAAAYASENGFDVLTTTLASSRWKSLEQVNAAGEYACGLFPGVTWWNMNWRKGGLQERRNQIIRERNFYNQLYCGCEFSLAGSPADTKTLEKRNMPIEREES
ncbi:MAG: epoxyqueuosine reductase QueH [Candidatus Cryptobacteroides sp.]